MRRLTLVSLAAAFLAAGATPTTTFLYTSARVYEPDAWTKGSERFPNGATLERTSAGTTKPLFPALAASADPELSYDAKRVLFSAKRVVADHWQIFEATLDGTAPRQVTRCDSDCIRPLYLPDGRIVYSHHGQLEVAPLEGGTGQRISFAPGPQLPSEVLADGRIVFEAVRAGHGRELMSVYPDGTGVEALRCDHGPDRHSARQLESGNLVFVSNGRLARFASEYAEQQPVVGPNSNVLGPVAEAGDGRWLLAWRPLPSRPYTLRYWDPGTAKLSPGPVVRVNAQSVQPVAVAPRRTPRRFPSALVPTRTAGNLLCLNVYASRMAIPEASVASVRFYTRNEGGATVALGQAPVEKDGSFYVQVPADSPLRMELLDATGKPVSTQHEWFWMRKSEQRVCVGCHAGPERAPENAVPEALRRSVKPVQLLGPAGGSQ